jgi:hypothetical protein
MQVARALLTEVISRHGVPEALLSDRGAAFCRGAMAHIAEWLGVKQLTTSPYHPQCNGLVERFNRTFIGMLRTYPARTRDREWDERLPLLLFAYRCHYNRNSQSSPFFLRYGHAPTTPASMFAGHTDATALSREDWLKEVVQFMPKNWQRVQDILEEHAQKIREQNEKLLAEGRLRVYHVGDKVYTLDHASNSQKLQYKTRPTWLGPFVVKTEISLTTYQLEDAGTHETFVVWSGHMKPAHDQMIREDVRDVTSAVDEKEEKEHQQH